MHNKLLINAVMTFFLLSTFCAADTLILKSGRQYEGDIYEYIHPEIRFKTNKGRDLILKVKNIQSITTDDPSHKKQTIIEEINTDIGILIEKNQIRAEATKSKNKKVRKKKKVELYMRSDSEQCYQMERFFRRNNIKYEAYNVRADEAARKRYRSYRPSGVPLTLVDGEAVYGYNPKKVFYLYHQ